MSITRVGAEDLGAALVRAGDAAFSWRLDDDRVVWSSGAAAALDWPGSVGLATGAALRAALRAEDCKTRDSWLAAGAPRGVLVGEYRLASAGPRQKWIEERLIAFDEPDGRRLLGLLRDVTARKEREARLSYLAFYDQMTGLLNRPRLREHLAQAVAGAMTGRGAAAYLVAGLDNMAGVNDAYGYDVADSVIIQLGARLEKLLSPGDSIGRVAGAKFGFVLPGRDAAGAAAFARRLLATAGGDVVETQAGPVAVTISVGGAIAPDHGRATHDVMAAADEALYRARANGPNSFILYEPRGQAAELRRRNIAIAEEIVSALNERRLALAYQPVVRSDDPRLVAFHECLIRMRDPSGKIVPAAEFMPVAEKLGLVRMLDRRVLELAFETLRWAPHARLSVNVSPQSVADAEWLRRFLELAEGRRDLTERLIIEITEATAIHDGDQTADFIHRLRDLGCAVAVDDFGAGYTSFRHFKKLKIDIVKIDGDFARGVATNAENQILTRTLVEIARAFDILTVAEMVSNEDDAAMLRGLGVDCLQGYHFGRPELNPAWLYGAGREGMGGAIQQN